VIRGLQFSPWYLDEGLEAELISNGVRFNQLCLGDEASIKTFLEGLQKKKTGQWRSPSSMETEALGSAPCPKYLSLHPAVHFYALVSQSW
jgi:hypothetical protein